MDFFALPDVFHRELMKKIGINDRLHVRLVCRSFERLVANTHAGSFENGAIDVSNSPIRIDVGFGDQQFWNIRNSNRGQFLHLRNGLFSGISFETFKCTLDDNPSNFDFIRELTEQFKIGALHISADSKHQLEFALRLFSSFPNSKYHLSIGGFLPDPETIIAFPTLESLEMWKFKQHDHVPGFNGERWTMSTDIFLKLLEIHDDVFVENIALTADKFKSALEIISEDQRTRSVEIWEMSSTVCRWLCELGVTESSNVGAVSNELEVVAMRESGLLRLRFRNCLINFAKFDWSDDRTVNITISNGN